MKKSSLGKPVALVAAGLAALVLCSSDTASAAASHNRLRPTVVTEVKGAPNTPKTGPAPARAGGPDAFGYFYRDQAEANGPVYEFVDISATGTAVTFDDPDDGVAVVPLSAPFSFYGQAFTSLAMGSNGYVSTDAADTGGDLSNDCPIPATPSSPSVTTGARIYPYHDDLVINGGARQQYFASCPRVNIAGGTEPCTVLMWTGATRYGQGDAFDFEVLLFHTSGELRYQYRNLGVVDGGAATIGIQTFAPAPATALQYECNTAASITSTSAISFFLDANRSDLVMTKTASNPDPAVGEAVTFTLGVNNAGPMDNTGVVVTDVLSAGLTYVSNSCGASHAGGTLTWTIGALANGASQSCQVVATMAVCGVTNTATVSGSLAEAAPANNSVSVTLPANPVADGGFEAGTPNPSWAEASTLFGTPLCDVAGCGTGGGTSGPHGGDWWVWFGGAGTDGPEVGSVTQSVTLPAGSTASLRFYFWNGSSSGNGQDYFRVTIDGTQIFNVLEGNATYTAGYTLVTLDLSAYANGAAHTLVFEGAQLGTTTTNFALDDVSIVACTTLQPADLSLTKSTASPIAAPGGSISYTLTVANAGPGAAQGVVVTDTIPAATTYVSNSCGASFAGGTLTWTVGDLASGGNATCSLVVTVGADAVGSISNTATAASTNLDPVSSNNTSTSDVTLAPLVDVVPTLNAVGFAALALALAIAGLFAIRRMV